MKYDIGVEAFVNFKGRRYSVGMSAGRIVKFSKRLFNLTKAAGKTVSELVVETVPREATVKATK